MALKFNFNLKEPFKEESLLLLLCRWNSQQIKVSCKLRVVAATWNHNEQVCKVNRRFGVSIYKRCAKVNKFISLVSERVVDYYEESYRPRFSITKI